MENLDDKYIVRIEDLKINISNKTIVDYSTINIPYGKTVIIEGPNGSGKSTFLNILAGQGGDYCKLISGKIYIYAKEIHDYSLDELKRKIVNINQEEAFLTNESAFHYLMRPALTAISSFKNKKELTNKIKKMIYQFYSNYLYKFFVDEIKNPGRAEKFRKNPQKDLIFMYFKKANNLSGGQKKMLHLISGIIKAKVAECNLILLDEPLNNLDKDNKKTLISILKELRLSNPNVTILLITHCRIFPGIKDIIKIKNKNNVNKAIYESFDNELPNYNCLEN